MHRFWAMIDDEQARPRRGSGIVIASLAGIAAVATAKAARHYIGVDLPFMFCVAAALATAIHYGALASLTASLTGLGLTIVLAPAADPLVTIHNAAGAAVFCVCIALFGGALLRYSARERRFAAIARRRERVLQGMFVGSPAITLIIDENDQVVAANEAAGRLFEQPSSALIGRGIAALIGEGLRSSRRRLTIGIGGRDRHLRVTATRMTLAGRRFQTIHIGDETDVTEAHEQLASTQRELYQIARATALGQLGSSIAHELNQPLASVANYSGVARALLTAADPDISAVRQVLDDTLDQVFRAGQVLKRLREFVRRRAFDRIDVDAAEVVGDAVRLGLLAVKEVNAELTVEVAPVNRTICVDVVQLQQVILNLMINAADAVRSQPVRRIAVRVWEDGETLFCAVSDNGPGIPSSLRTTVFEPFRSSKEQGIGIGLAICRTIVEAHAEKIWCDTDPVLGGARFAFSLPLSNSREAEDVDRASGLHNR